VKPLSPNIVARVEELHCKGLGTRAIADKLKIGRTSVRRVLALSEPPVDDSPPCRLPCVVRIAFRHVKPYECAGCNGARVDVQPCPACTARAEMS